MIPEVDDEPPIETSDEDNEDESSDEDVKENLEIETSAVDGGKRKFTEESSENDASAPSKKIKVETFKKMKPPTAEELSRLKETENLFHSNLFRLQIEEILKETKLKDSIIDKIRLWSKKLKKALWSVEETNKVKVSDLKWLKEQSIKIPLKQISKDVDSEFIFKKPSKVEMVGSYSLGFSLGTSITIDVIVQIPDMVFDRNDHKNEKYHFKRGLYLCSVAHALLENEEKIIDEEIQFALQDHNVTRPMLVIKPAGNLGQKVTVYIRAVPSMSMCKPIKLSPSKNNVKSDWYFPEKEDVENEPATPFYNESILEDVVTLLNENLRKKVFLENPKFKDAMILLRIWLKQRMLDEGYGSFSNYIMSMFLVYLSRIRRLNKFMSSYQILRNVWIVLSQTDWTANGISLHVFGKNNDELSSLPSSTDFHTAHDVVFIDVTGYHNICANVSKIVYLKVKSESALALECLDSLNLNSFHDLFMTPVSFLQHYDNVISFENVSTIKDIVKTYSPRNKQLDYRNNIVPQFISLITGLLQESLGDRISKIGFEIVPTSQKWSIREKFSSKIKNISVRFGFILNPEKSMSIVHKGPDANLLEAKTFRQFWGKKSELRRFRDGTVCEALVWAEEDDPLSVKRITTEKMVKYLLQHKFELETSQYQYASNQLEVFLENKQFIPHGFKYGTGEEACLKVMNTFDQLGKELRSLKYLPLSISTIVGVSPAFRYSDVFPPLAQTINPSVGATTLKGGCVMFNDEQLTKCTNYIPAIDGIIHLIKSGKWPDNLDAIRRIKAAFYIKLAELLRKVYSLVCQPFPEYLAVIKDGFVFRLRIFYSGEITLLKQSINEEGLIEHLDTEESLALERDLVHLPQISAAIHGLHLRYPSLGPACALAKRWLNSQLLDDSHFPSIVVELLISSLFTSPHPHYPAFNPQSVFLRFLALLSRSDWNTEPLIVNFDSELQGTAVTEMEKSFRNERENFPPLVIFTPYDETGSVWTKTNPSAVIFNRTIKLAAQALQLFETYLLKTDASLQIMGLFVPPLEAYDILINLKVCMLPRQWHSIDAENNERFQLSAPKSTVMPITDFDPAQSYLNELRRHYSDIALFFHDTYGGSVIGVLLKPDIMKPQENKTKFLNGRYPSSDKEKKESTLLFNIDALIEDFNVMGKDLVESVKLNK